MDNEPKEEPDYSEQSKDDADLSNNKLEQMEIKHNRTNN